MALLGSSDNSVQILVASKADNKGIDSARRSLGQLDKSSHSSGGSMINLGKFAAIAKTGLVALGAALGTAAAFGVKSAADFQQTRIGLENMLGSADKARDLLADISKFAADTPFEFPELAQATRQLVAFGFTGKEAFSTMKQLGDVSAAVGAPMNDLAYLMGTLKTQGRAFTIDIRQFAQRGIPIYEYLAKVLGKSEKEITGMIEKGKIGFPEVQKAFTAMTGEGGKFHNTMSMQSKSLSGLFSTLKDNIGATTRELVGISAQGDVIKGSLFDKIQNGLTWVNANMPKMIDNFNRFKAQAGVLATTVASHLMPAFRSVWSTLSTQVIPTFMRLWKEIIVPLLPIIGVVMAAQIFIAVNAFKVFALTTRAFVAVLVWFKNTSINNFKLVAAAAVWAATKIVQAFNWVRHHLGIALSAFNTIRGKVMSGVNGIYNILTSPFRLALAYIKSIPSRIGNIGGQIKSKIGNYDLPGPLGTIGSLIPGFAAGTNFAPGGTALVGERGPELVNLPRGSQVLTANQTRGMAGTTNNNRSVSIGTVVIQNDKAAKSFWDGFDNDMVLVGQGLTPLRGLN